MALIFGWFNSTPIVADPYLSPEDSASSALTALAGLTVESGSFVQNASVGTLGNTYITDGDADEAVTADTQNIAMPVDVGGETRYIDEIVRYGDAGGGAPNSLTYDGVTYDAAALGPITVKVLLFTDGTSMVVLDDSALDALRTELGLTELDPTVLQVTLGGNEDAVTFDRDWGIEASNYDGAGQFTAPASDQVVSGSAEADLIDASYSGDPEGDQIDSGGSNDDVIVAGGGDDTIIAGLGGDEASGGAGDDVVYGDSLNDGEPGQEISPLRLSASEVRAGSGTATDPLDVQVDDSVIFDNVGTLVDGTAVSAKLTLVSTTNAAMDIAFNRDETEEIVLNNLGDPAYQGEQATFRLEFIDAVTGAPLVLTGQATFGDIDLNGSTNATNFERVVLDASHITGYELSPGTNLDVSTPGGMVTATGTVSNNPADEPAWFTANFQDTNALTFTLTARAENSGYTLNGQVIEDPVIFDLLANDDTLSGGLGEDTLYGQAGDDVVSGDAGADEIYGGLGADTLYGGSQDSSADTVYGGAGADQILNGDGDDLSYGGVGGDSLYMGAGADSAFGGAGADLILGHTGNDILEGGAGQDILSGGAGADTVLGGDDQDVIYGASGDSIDGGSGGIDDDTLYVRDAQTIAYDTGNAENGTVTFTDGSTLNFAEIEHVVTLASDGIVSGTTQDDLIDLLYVDADGDFIDNNDAIGTFGTLGEDDYVLAGAGNDTVYAGDGKDQVFGEAGADSIAGGIGDDSLVGGADADLLFGDAGNDVLIGDYEIDSDFGVRGDPVAGPGEDDSLLGGDGKDTIYGGSGDDSIDGGDGDDSILGGHGDDTLIGGLGNDDLEGLYGNDVIYGGDGDDHVFGRDGADLIYGGDGNDSLIGSIGIDTLYGGKGNDLLAGSQGSDLIYGGEGNDLVFIGVPAFGDIAYDSEGSIYLDEGNDFLDASDATLRFDAYGGDGNDQMNAGVGDDTLFGGEGNDTINGGAGNDIIHGDAGLDRLNGGDDRDILFGGAGDTIDGGEGGDDFDVLNLSGLGGASKTNIIYGGGDNEAGTVELLDGTGTVTGSFVFSNIESIVPCFTPGSLILTDSGERKVEDLLAGDLVLTRDNGYQTLRWAGGRDVFAAEMGLHPQYQPVRIAAGAMGMGLPVRDIMVSPQHRMLVTGVRAEMLFGEHEVLVPAIHMVNDHSIRRMKLAKVRYLHLLFDQHEVICADGAWTESFQPGDQTLRGMDDDQRAELFGLFPELQTEAGADFYPAARLSLKAHEAKVLLAG